MTSNKDAHSKKPLKPAPRRDPLQLDPESVDVLPEANERCSGYCQGTYCRKAYKPQPEPR